MNCAHIRHYKNEYGLEAYETINGFFITKQNGPSQHKVLINCFDCNSYSSRLLACMQCIYFGCLNKHVKEHATYNKHNLYVELSNGHIYCYICSDYVYDSDVEIIAEKHRLKVSNWSSCPAFNGPTRYLPWRPSVAEAKVLQQHKNRIKVDPSTKVGMRGMVNLGSTCFMSCVMQAFLHTPIMRDYFFADKHRCKFRKTKDCFFCRFSRLFQKYYADDKSLVSSHEILYLVWQNYPLLTKCEEKDAQEFFISVLNLLHQHSTNSQPTYCSSTSSFTSSCSSSSTWPSTNPSIIDLIFRGKMQSDVVCQSCANVSTKIEPFLDISLDIPDVSQTGADLYQCLHHFTRAEVISNTHCSTCEDSEESTKQLTFRLLPIVIVIHLKRFDYVNRKKKSLYVSFPMELDMSPYTSNCRNQSTNVPYNVEQTNVDNRYTLYAVVVHLGIKLDTGHYLAYIRQTNHSWFTCSDDEVAPADINKVMSSEGYLLFYHKTILNYK